MNDSPMETLLQKIERYPRIILSRHIRPDGDAVGSAMGLAEILRLSYPEKEIYVANDDRNETLRFLDIREDDPADALYADALLITLDTATADRLSNHRAALAKEIIKIDHHPKAEDFSGFSWIEAGCSSTCEMIASLCLAYPDRLRIDRTAATLLYVGMVTDSGRFRFSSTSPQTMRCAAFLLEQGIDTEQIYANLYTEELAELKFRAAVLRRIKTTANGVAYLCVSRALREKYGLGREQAGNTVSLLSNIRGSLIWMALIEEDDGSMRVRLRSRFVTIRALAEQFGGGGHDCACGATVHTPQEMRLLLRRADALLRSYKETHEDWL